MPLNHPGRVYALSLTERDEFEAIALDRQQAEITQQIRTALEAVTALVKTVPDPPYGWPTFGYDRETMLSVLDELMPGAVRTEDDAAAAKANTRLLWAELEIVR